MKRLIVFILLYLSFNNSLFCALTGTGDYNTPFSGTVDSEITWLAGTFPNDEVWVGTIAISAGFTLTIGPGVTVKTRAGGSMTISGTLEIGAGAGYTARSITNNSGGLLRINSDADGIGSLIHTGYSDLGGTVETEIYLTGGTSGGSPIWHYISSPVNECSTNVFTANPITLNLAQYVEALVNSEDNTTGWIAYDGYIYTGGGSNPAYAFASLRLGSGYTYHCAESTTRSITGPLNYSNSNVTLTCGTGYIDYQGYNLVGNPFPSCFDWDSFYEDLPLEVNDAIYFTLEGTIAAYVGGVGINGGTGTIPPMQGFFVKVNSPTTGISLELPATARVHNLDQIRYKKKSTGYSYRSSDTISFVRLQLLNSESSTDLVVRFNEKATTSVDKRFDSYKFSKVSGALNIWTTTSEVDYSINGLPFPETTMEIPVGINVNTGGTFILKSAELNRLDNYSITLKDLSTNRIVNLKEGGSIDFEATAGMIENRFILTISKSATVIPEIFNDNKKFSIYCSSGTINILSLTDEFSNTRGSITVYDLTGRKVYQQNDIEWQATGDLEHIMLNPARQGLYFVELMAGNMKYVEKVAIH